MTVQINGTTGIDVIQDGAVSSTAKLANSIVTPAKTQVGATPSFVRVHTANGYGSTNTKIRRFTTTVVNQGSDITYADSATLGGSFTINTTGTYAISYSDQFGALSSMTVTLNDTTPTGAVAGISASQVIAGATTVGANTPSLCACTLMLTAGDVIRAHTEGSAAGSSVNLVQFFIVRVA